MRREEEIVERRDLSRERGEGREEKEERRRESVKERT